MENTTLRLTLTARLNLMQVLNTLAKGKGSDKKQYRVAVRIYNKIEVPAEELEKLYQIQTPYGPRANEPAIREAPMLEVPLSRQEVERLEDVLDSIEDLPPAAAKLWWDDLMSQIENAAFRPDVLVSPAG